MRTETYSHTQYFFDTFFCTSGSIRNLRRKGCIPSISGQWNLRYHSRELGAAKSSVCRFCELSVEMPKRCLCECVTTARRSHSHLHRWCDSKYIGDVEQKASAWAEIHYKSPIMSTIGHTGICDPVVIIKSDNNIRAQWLRKYQEKIFLYMEKKNFFLSTYFMFLYFIFYFLLFFSLFRISFSFFF